jgi:UDP-glucose 4-epimerase
MQYLVTGGCGFIGSHLVERLLAAKHCVTVLDDLSTGKRDNISSEVRFVEGDITTPGIFDSLVKEIDGCFHLAAIASVERSQREPDRTHEVNYSASRTLMDALAAKKTPLVFASSAAVYGDNPHMPLKENSSCVPLSPYGADKLACEQYAKISGIPAIGLRLFNVYGERQDPNSPYSGVISIFTDRMQRNQPVTIYGDGEQQRDFIHVGDVTTGLTLAMQRLHKNPKATGVFNLATGTPISINQLAQAIRDITMSASSITHAPARAGDIRISLGNTELSQTELRFTAVVPLREGLRRTLAIAA